MKVLVIVRERNLLVLAMLRGLAHQVGGQAAVKGVTNQLLVKNGYVTFKFSNDAMATDFRKYVNLYLVDHIGGAA